MIAILGTGYIASALTQEARRRNRAVYVLSRSSVDYTKFAHLRAFLADARPELLINAAGFIGHPNVDQCEHHKTATLMGNVVLVETVANACEVTAVPWAQICSGCIYQGFRDQETKAGWRESDPPNFNFETGDCSWYSGSKAVSEQVLMRHDAYGWRLRIPFNEQDHPRNYLTKLRQYQRLLDVPNSLSHLGDFASACLDLWDLRAAGLFNIVNSGYMTTHKIVNAIRRYLGGTAAQYFADEQEMYRQGAAVARRSSCVLDNSKLRDAGVAIRNVEDAVLDACHNWRYSQQSTPAPA